MKHRIPVVSSSAAALLVAGLLLGLSPRDGAAEGEDWAARARTTWHKTCRRCHTVPDATYETGRAFLAQITGTS